MQYISKYNSPLGEILIASDDNFITGLWFINQKYYADGLDDNAIYKETDIIKLCKQWLDEYFSGIIPRFEVPIKYDGTDFQEEVWKILYRIPYGEIITYKDIANIIASNRGIEKMSSQAVGNAVSRNRISIIIPCHRVVGSDGALTGYAGGITRKKELLLLEQNNK